MGYYGGFRSCELKSLTFQNVEMDEAGYWISFTRSKQRSLSEESTICVPRRQDDWASCSADASRRPIDFDPASLLDLYFEQVVLDFGCTREELSGFLFKGSHGKDGKRFTQVNMGKNAICRVGIEIAEELLLPHPESFTGHCWRRSAGTNASNAGVNVTTLMSMMGWSCPKTAMEYVKRSRVTSLQMSMYLTNVQRHNVAVPFPSNSVERRRKTLAPERPVPKVSMRSGGSTIPLLIDDSGSKELEEFEAFFGTQDLLQEFAGSQELFRHLDDEGGDVGRGGGEEKVPVGDTNVIPESAMLPSSISSSSSVSSSNTTSSAVVPISVSDSVESRLSSILHNLHNHGNLEIHFHFADK